MMKKAPTGWRGFLGSTVFLLAFVGTACVDLLGPAAGFDIDAVDTIFVSPFIDFGAVPGRPVEEPAGAQRVDDFVFTPLVNPRDTALSAPPMDLSLAIRVANPADSVAVLWMRGCEVWPEFYTSPARDELVWRPERECGESPSIETIQPNDSSALYFGVHDVLLGRHVPDGRHYLTLKLRRLSDTLSFEAGSVDVRLDTPGLAYRLRLTTSGDSIATTVRVENTNPFPVVLEFGACPTALAFYRDPEMEELEGRLHSPFTCPAYLRVEELDPGATAEPGEFRQRFSESWLDRSEIRPGRYFLALELDVNWRTRSFPVGPIELR